MKASGELHVPAILSMKKEPSLPIEQETGKAP